MRSSYKGMNEDNVGKSHRSIRGMSTTDEGMPSRTKDMGTFNKNLDAYLKKKGLQREFQSRYDFRKIRKRKSGQEETGDEENE